MERLKRFADTNPARARIERCDDIVFCGTASDLAISPAASPSGSCFTSNRNTSSLVDWASAASARIVSSDSIYPELWIYAYLSSLAVFPRLQLQYPSYDVTLRSDLGRRISRISNTGQSGAVLPEQRATV